MHRFSPVLPSLYESTSILDPKPSGPCTIYRTALRLEWLMHLTQWHILCMGACALLPQPLPLCRQVQFVITENGRNPGIFTGIVSAVNKSSKNWKSNANSVKLFFVSSLPIIILRGILHWLLDSALMVKGLSSRGLLVTGHWAARSVILIPPAIIDKILL